MNILLDALQTPWKIKNRLSRWLIHPWMRLVMAANGIRWEKNWSFYGTPIIQKHRQSIMRFGPGFSLRSTVHSNPLGPNHPVILSTMRAGAVLEIGDNFGMTGGSICASEKIKIGNEVAVGANSIIVDTDFHPLDPVMRLLHPQDGKSAPIVIEDNVFIGMNCLILKGVNIGKNSIIGAGSIVTKSIPANSVVAGNPAVSLRKLSGS